MNKLNNLATIHPDIAAEWHPTKNGIFTSEDFAPKSNKKVWWLCSVCNFEWEAMIASRTKGHGCPQCGRRKSAANRLNTNIIKTGSLQDTHPELVSEWHPTKNKELTPQNFTCGSNKKVWWRCTNGHEWKAVIASRALNNRKCPYCAGNLPIIGETDLASTHSELINEWHPTKNGDLTPQAVKSGSNKKVWWRCELGHEWQATIASRASGRKCPVCMSEGGTSFPEQAILYYLKKVAVTEHRNINFGKEIDIYLPEYQIGIEHNGRFYHQNKDVKDVKKINYFTKKNIRIITLKEGENDYIIGDVIEYKTKNNESLSWAITTLFEIINLPTTPIDVSKDSIKIYEGYIMSRKENSLAVLCPEVAAEWHPSKNGSLTPDAFILHSNKKVWWLGKCGHEWEAVINSRVRGGYGCPKCGYKKAAETKVKKTITQKGSLQDRYPEIAAEWNPTKNGNLWPGEVTPYSNKYAWWICSVCGFEWNGKISNRTSLNRGCPECGKKKSVMNKTLNKKNKPSG